MIDIKLLELIIHVCMKCNKLHCNDFPIFRIEVILELFELINTTPNG